MAENTRYDSSSDGYTVRRFESGSGDREGFLSLYETVWGEARTPEWFAWRYEDNPYTDHVPVFVAESADGEIVGARPLAAFRMRTPRGTVPALHPSDTMVHPDHRGQGLFSRMSAACTDYYTEGGPAFYFNFPNEAALKGNLKFGYRVVGAVPSYYRIQSPSALLDGALSDLDGWQERVAKAGATAAATGYLGLRDRTASVDRDATVRRYAAVPASLLESLYERGRPETIHADRDAAFYRWRYADPEHPPTTYVARRGSAAVAALITYADTLDGVKRVKIAEVLPMTETPGRSGAVARLLSVVADDNRDADVLAATGSAFPPGAMRALGFHRDDQFPLSRVTEETTLVAYPLVEDAEAAEAWRLGGSALDEMRDWTVTFAERDTT